MQRGVNQTLAWIISFIVSGGILAGVIFAVVKFTPRELNLEDTSVLRLEDVPEEKAGHGEGDGSHGKTEHAAKSHGEDAHEPDAHGKEAHGTKEAAHSHDENTHEDAGHDEHKSEHH
jgi:hypothetical protein